MLPNTAPISFLRLTLRMRNSNTTTPAPTTAPTTAASGPSRLKGWRKKAAQASTATKKVRIISRSIKSLRLPDGAASLLGAAPTGRSVGDQYITEIEPQRRHARREQALLRCRCGAQSWTDP